ncbi:MAG: hypothetical protein WCJ81_07295 [bacterium]
MPNAKLPILNENQIIRTITHNIVEPTLAPIIAPIAFGRVSKPAPTNAKIIRDTTLLDCKILVIVNQLIIDLNGVLATFLSRFFNVSPEICLIVSSRRSIPKSTIANHARNVRMENGISWLSHYVKIIPKYMSFPFNMPKNTHLHNDY